MWKSYYENDYNIKYILYNITKEEFDILFGSYQNCISLNII